MIVSYDTIINMNKKPSFTITAKILKLAQDISQKIGYLYGSKLTLAPVTLRKVNKIKTIQSSLAIEGNTLSADQITAILENKRVIAPKKEIIEVENAIHVYNKMREFNPISINSFLNAHKIMMKSLIKDNGLWRRGNVGIMQGNKVSRIAPQAKMLPKLMTKLFEFISSNEEISWLIKACIFHYELEFIHPFSDGNGRMGRLWQQLILMKEDKIFEYIPIETLIKENQHEYYEVLAQCDNLGQSTLFIEFMLQQIYICLAIYCDNTMSEINTPIARLNFAAENFQKQPFSRKDYILLHKNISTSTASRDLKLGINKHKLKNIGQNNQTLYKFIIS